MFETEGERERERERESGDGKERQRERAPTTERVVTGENSCCLNVHE